MLERISVGGPQIVSPTSWCNTEFAGGANNVEQIIAMVGLPLHVQRSHDSL